MAEYSLTMNATSNTSINTDDVFVELGAASGNQFKVKRVRVGYGDGSQTVGLDNHFKVKLYRWDVTTGGSSSAGVIVKKNPLSPTAVTAAKIKTTTTALALGGTNVEILDNVNPNNRAIFEWIARDEDDYWWSKAGTAAFFAVVIASAVTAQKFQVTVEWME
jgi:hypothetical protein